MSSYEVLSSHVRVTESALSVVQLARNIKIIRIAEKCGTIAMRKVIYEKVIEIIILFIFIIKLSRLLKNFIQS